MNSQRRENTFFAKPIGMDYRHGFINIIVRSLKNTNSQKNNGRLGSQNKLLILII